MISAHLREDIFVVWSVDHAALQARCRGARVTAFEGRGWLVFAAVRMERIRIGGWPLPFPAAVAAVMAVCDLRSGRRGNLALTGWTGNHLVRLADQLHGGVITAGCVRFHQQAGGLAVTIDGKVDLTLDRSRALSVDDQRRLDHLFAGNRSGIWRRDGRIVELPLWKRAWPQRGHPAVVRRADFLAGWDARLEFAFDASQARSCWLRPRVA